MNLTSRPLQMDWKAQSISIGNTCAILYSENITLKESNQSNSVVIKQLGWALDKAIADLKLANDEIAVLRTLVP